MLKLEHGKDVAAWLDSSGIDQLVIISPHLDDAVFSLGSVIAAVPENTMVVTVHTEGAPDVAIDWAHAGGFADPMEEHAARRSEDQQAMEYLGCRFSHLGLRSGELSEATARYHLQALWRCIRQPSSSMLILLPAGAGGVQPVSPAKRWVRRILRQPFGSVSHSEHESARDHFLSALSDTRGQIGFYAEIPYGWNETRERLVDRLSALSSSPLKKVRIKPDWEKKLIAAECYSSQVGLILGRRRSYRKRVLSGDEQLFLMQKRETAVD